MVFFKIYKEFGLGLFDSFRWVKFLCYILIKKEY